MTTEYWTKQLEQEIPQLLSTDGVYRIRSWIDAAAEQRKEVSCAFMDATTLARVERLLSDAPGLLDVFALWDLSTFVTAVVLNEHVFHIGTEGLDSLVLNEGLDNQPVIIEIPGPSNHGDVRRTLLPIWYGTRSYLRRLEAKRQEDETWTAMQACWQELFGPQKAHFKVFNDHILDGYFTSENWVLEQLQTDFLPPSSDAEFLMNMPPAHIDEFTVLNTARGVYNLALSEAIELPYHPCCSRLPVRRSIVDDGNRVLWRASEVLQSAFQTTRCSLPALGHVRFPLFLSAVLRRAAKNSEILSVLAELRYQAAPLRQKCAEIEQAARLGDEKTIEALTKALAADGSALALKWLVPVSGAAVLAMLPKVGTLAMKQAIILAALAGLLKFKSQTVEAISDLVFRPHLTFLTRVSNESRACLNCWEKAKELWPRFNDSRANRRLAMLSRWAELE